MFFYSEVFAMDRFVSKRSSSSLNLDSSSLDDVRTERAAIALSVGLSWPPVKRRRSAGRPSWQQLWERALQHHTLEHHDLPHGVRLQRPAWWRPGEAIDQPLTHEELALCFIPPRSTSYLQPCDVAVFRNFKSCIQTQASATLARPVLDGSFEGLAMNKAWRRQSSAEWASRAATDLCDEKKVWTTGWHRMRAGSNAEFREAVAEAAALHAHDELFSKHIEPEPAPEDPVEWAMAEATDDEDDAPMPDAPPEPELIDMPPAPASAPRMSNLERCIALRFVYGAGPR